MTRRFWRIAALLLLLAALYSAGGYWLAPRLVNDALGDYVRERLGHRLELRAVKVDPWRLTLELAGASLRTKNGDLLAQFEKLEIDLEAASLWSGAWRLRQIALVAPRAEISRNAEGQTNWTALFAALPQDDGSAPARVRVGRAVMERGEIGYADQSLPAPLLLRAKQVALEVKGFSNEAGAKANYTLSAVLQDGAQFASKGSFGDPARDAAGELAVQGLSAATLLELAGSRLAATRGTVLASARFALRGKFGSLVVEQVDAAVSDLGLTLAGGNASAASISLQAGRFEAAAGSIGFGRLRVVDAAVAGSGDDAPQVRLAQFSLDTASASLGERHIGIERAELVGLEGRDELDAKGSSRLAGLFAQPAAPSAPGSKPQPDWSVAMQQLEAKDSAWRLAWPGDAASGTPPRAIEIREIELAAAQLRYPEGDPFKASAGFVFSPAGRVSATGSVDPRGRSASLALRVEELPLKAAQPWIEPHLALQIGAGSLDLDGTLAIAAKDATPAAEFTGKLKVSGLQVTDSATRQPLFGAKAIQARGLKLGILPMAVAIEELSLQAPVGRIALAEDGTLNLGTLRRATAKDPAESGAAKRMPLVLRKIALRDGRLDFSDLSIRPAFTVRIDELSGAMTGLDAARAVPATVALDGRVGEFGAAKIRGALDPFAPGTDTDLTLDLRNLEISALDPYARRFAGYRIESGKLAGALRYRARQGKLEGENRLVIDKLKLGARVESAQAADLPLELAIALLTDSQGRIAIEIPVRGDLDRAEFDLGQVIGQAVGGAIGKVITAPFQLLAGLFGGGEQAIDRIDFESGSAKLAPPEREKIVAVARALGERPQLRLRVAATFDGAADGEALRNAKLPVNPDALLALARARAESVRQALVAQGVDANRIGIAPPAVSSADPKQGIPAGLTLSVR